MNEVNPYEAPASAVDEEAELEGGIYGGGGQLASRGSRLGAKILDSVAFFVPFMVVAFLASAFGSAAEPVMGVGMVLIFLGVAGLNIYWLYDNGQTIGKRALDIKIVRSDARTRATLTRILLARALPVGVLSALPCVGSIFSIADAVFIFRDDRRCIHDHIADTVVVIDGTVPGEEGAFDQKYLEDTELETFDESDTRSSVDADARSFDDADQEW